MSRADIAERIAGRTDAELFTDIENLQAEIEAMLEREMNGPGDEQDYPAACLIRKMMVDAAIERGIITEAKEVIA